MSSTICNTTFDCADPSALARFWGQVTGLPVIEEPQPGYPESAVGDSRPRLYFVKVPEGKIVKNRVHLDIMPNDRTQDAEIARVLRRHEPRRARRRPGGGKLRIGAAGKETRHPPGQRARGGCLRVRQEQRAS